MSWRDWPKVLRVLILPPTFRGQTVSYVVLALLILPAAFAAFGAWVLFERHRHTEAPTSLNGGGRVGVSDKPPWVYGRPDARFTLVEYADLECPYCREYLPILRQLVAQHPDVNLQWHHLPLAEHEPAAAQSARLAECAGEVGGTSAFWAAVDWIYGHTRGNGTGLPDTVRFPQLTPRMQECLQSSRPDTIIAAQAAEAARDHVAATPTLRIVDRQSGRSLTLRGMIESDALLSAIDFVSAPRDDRNEPEAQ